MADINKVKASDMNEIKQVVNANYDDVGNIADLNTEDISSIVNAINELLTDIKKTTPVYYYTNSENSLTFTPTYDCYCEVDATYTTWGYGGGTTTVSISITGTAQTIYNYNGIGNGGNSVARDVSARALFKLTAGTSYTISMGRANSGGAQSKRLLCKLIPYVE